MYLIILWTIDICLTEINIFHLAAAISKVKYHVNFVSAIWEEQITARFQYKIFPLQTTIYIHSNGVFTFKIYWARWKDVWTNRWIRHYIVWLEWFVKNFNVPILDYAVVIYKKDVTLIGKLDEERFQPSNNSSIWVQAQQKNCVTLWTQKTWVLVNDICSYAY